MSDKSVSRIKIAVIGAGASGMMAAAAAAENGADVTLYERNAKPGRKLAITGKGRCNLTNDCDINEFLLHVPRNPKFLYASLSAFSPKDTINFFEALGVPLKCERGRRVFPVSDKSYDIVDALNNRCKRNGVRTVNARVSDIKINDNSVVGLTLSNNHNNVVEYDKIIVACGGLSYPTTGSDGDGYKFAESAEIRVTKTYPSLVPLNAGYPCAKLQGLTLKNITLRIKDDMTGKYIFDDLGELLFTHFGMSGPLVLSASAHMKPEGSYTAVIDMKPALDDATLDARLLSDFSKYINCDMINASVDLLPQSLIPYVLERAGIDIHDKCNSLTRVRRAAMIDALKRFEIKIDGFRPIDEAVITSGGVDTAELNPATMESKKVSGLYFCGEVINVDAYTGGYNLQIAFSTGRAAGIAAAVR